MQARRIIETFFLIFSVSVSLLRAASDESISVYQWKLNDPEAFYFTPDSFNICADGKTDVSDELQAAINKVKLEKNFGILFIPEGKYLISKTIYIPGSVRLIGYGRKRPMFVLGRNTPGYQEPDPQDKANANYMFWFTSGIVTPGEPIRDASAGTFYSTFSNIDITIEKGNPAAIALRTHVAQHGFVSHCNIYIGDGKAGIFDVGNEMEDVKFFGGDFGVLTTMTSPSWPMLMVDTYFEGQRKAAISIFRMGAGLVIVNLHARNVPSVVEIAPGIIDRLFMENCRFENVSDAGIIISKENNSLSQINLRNIDCINVPILAKYRESGKKNAGPGKQYRVKSFTYGLCLEDMTSNGEYKTLIDAEPLSVLPDPPGKDIPQLPIHETWVNIRDLGAMGDGETDDTKVFQDAIAKYQYIYVPQGWYRLTETLKMAENTHLIGLHPFGTQFMLAESTPAFSGFGSPKPLVESSEGGNDVFTGIGINTGGYNYRAVGMKWMAGAGSLLNDVKFVGGHGTLRKGPYQPFRWSRNREISSPGNPINAPGKDLAWDNQYWSLWVTNNGGGTIKDIWSANTYATNGLFVTNTSTPGRIYAISLEHHVRNEATFKNVSNWKVYAFQLEEESREGADCEPVDMINCKDMVFANFWQFRVIRVRTPRPTGVRQWDCENIEILNSHAYAQVMFVTEVPYFDVNKDLSVYTWEFAKLTITGKEAGKRNITHEVGKVEKLASEFEFAQGITSDSKGNVYFCETRLSRIYKWSVETNTVTLIADFPWNPFSLATDTRDNLLVVFRYDPQPGYMVDGEQESVPVLPDDNPGYSGWGNSGWTAWAYSIDPDNPEETFKPMKRIPTGEIKSIHKALYPSSRWRYDFDQAIVYIPESCFVAPDGVTIIPETYDLGRSAALSEAFPGKSVYIADESLKKVVKLNVGDIGKLSDSEDFVQKGEFSQAMDREGNLYVADGKIFVYDKNGNKTGIIEVEERPISITFGGRDGNTLFITTRTSLFSIKVK